MKRRHEEISEKIAVYLIDNGIKQTFIARKIEVHPVMFNDILLGKRPLSLDVYIKVCKALKVSLDTFV